MLLGALTTLYRMALPRLALVMIITGLVTSVALLTAYSINALVYPIYSIPLRGVSGNAIIVTGSSIAPFTSMISVTDIYEKLEGLNTSIEQIVIAPIIIDNKLVLVVSNSSVKETGKEVCIIRLPAWYARELGISTNNTIMFINAPFAATSIPVEIVFRKGISNAYTSLSCARVLRGFPADKASIVVIRANNRTTLANVLKSLGLEAPSNEISKIIYVAAKWVKKRTSYEKIVSPQEMFLEKLGIQQALVIAVAILAASLLELLVYLMPPFATELLKREILVLEYIGVPFNHIRASILATMFISIGVVAAATVVIQQSRYAIRIYAMLLSGPVTPRPHLLVTIIVIVISVMIATISAHSLETIKNSRSSKMLS